MPSSVASSSTSGVRPIAEELMDVLRRPVSSTFVRRGQLAAGAFAVAGSAAVLLGWGDAAEAKAASSTPSPSYGIRAGDTLSGIAAKHGVSVSALASANGLSPKSVIVAGRSLKIPSGAAARVGQSAKSSMSYAVRRGDTLSSIAAKHGVSVSALAGANGMSTRAVLSIGKTLTVPGVTGTSPAATKPGSFGAGDNRAALDADFRRAASRYGVPLSLLKAMTWNESGWQNHVTSGVGARGIGQIMPSTAQHINANLSGGAKLDPNKPADNIAMSAIYLRYLIDENHGDYRMALASYYQGLASVRSRGMYDDTKQYVRTILALQRNYF